ncbi:gliding motility protein [Streptomyces odonnellii]|uniref:gliding motility protein n=1 Tax=Streptomyces odonnellii TaxID=1417980 RepID=UPI001E3FEEA1|nr:gliding motility protein [Streptomyces odonnellii]
MASTEEAEAATATADAAGFTGRDAARDGAEVGAKETGAAGAGPAESDRTEAPAAEGVEIPKQQSAEAAADNEAGKSTRG